jgi:hypothetical protein
MRARQEDGECRGDLVARAQRDPLSAAEQSALRAHLACCASCRVIQRVASDFAGMRAVERGDDTRLNQMSALARRAAGGQGQRGRRRPIYTPLRAAAVAAGVILLLGTASAAMWLLPRHARRAPENAAVTVAAAPAAAPAAAVVAWEAPPVAPVVVPGAPPRLIHQRPGARESAAALLRAARAAANDGHAEAAVALYRRLQREFRGSSEAVVSAVPLGRLLLERASPRAALAEFTRYLNASAGGVLIPEALYGRAQALARLDDRTKETETWRRLVSEFPDSPYSAVARRRLSELK